MGAGKPQRRKHRDFADAERDLPRRLDLVEDLDILIGDLCQNGGFCNQLKAADLIHDDEPVTADAFARAVLIAEGLVPEYEKQFFTQIKRSFVHRYGQSVRSSDLK